MKFYAVISDFYDDGKTKAYTFVVEADSKPEDTYEERKDHDRYVDYFTNPVEAEKHRQNTLKA